MAPRTYARTYIHVRAATHHMPRCSWRLLSALSVPPLLLVLLATTSRLLEEETVYVSLRSEAAQLRGALQRCRRTSSTDASFRAPPTSSVHLTCPAGTVARDGACVACPAGAFSLIGWSACRPLLDCEDVAHDVAMAATPFVNAGRWRYFVSEWNNYVVFFGKVGRDGDEPVRINLDHIHALLPHPNLAYPIGFCEATQSIVLATDKTYLEPVSSLDPMLSRMECDHWSVRFQLALDYVRVLAHLHSNSSTPHILCNSHSLEHVLSQFLITDELSLVLVALDNLPALPSRDDLENESESNTETCSANELKGEFVSPEQKWPFSQSKVFNPAEQPGSTEKSDTWKIPPVTRYFLGSSKGSYRVLSLLRGVHARCRQVDPRLRPSASEVLREYETVWRIVAGDSV